MTETKLLGMVSFIGRAEVPLASSITLLASLTGTTVTFQGTGSHGLFQGPVTIHAVFRAGQMIVPNLGTWTRIA